MFSTLVVMLIIMMRVHVNNKKGGLKNVTLMVESSYSSRNDEGLQVGKICKWMSNTVPLSIVFKK